MDDVLYYPILIIVLLAAGLFFTVGRDSSVHFCVSFFAFALPVVLLLFIFAIR